MDTYILKVNSTNGLKEYEGSEEYFLESITNDGAATLKILKVIDDKTIRVAPKEY